MVGNKGKGGEKNSNEAVNIKAISQKLSVLFTQISRLSSGIFTMQESTQHAFKKCMSILKDNSFKNFNISEAI